MNGTDVGMVQSGGGPGFALEARQRLRVSGDFVRQELQGDKAVQARVLSLEHHTHAACPELLKKVVMRDGLTDEKRCRGHKGC